VSTVPATETSAGELLDAARGGDSDAFQALVVPHLRALHLHSYRMLGSYADAEEAVQESMLRAWQGLSGFEGRAPLVHWLYRITTTTCLKMIRRRRREPATTAEVGWLQPYPDALIDQIADVGADPAAIAERRESVALAFIAALQLLPASQRAVLILRDVLAWPARDVADLLDSSVPAVNSARQRARATLAAADPDGDGRALSESERRVVDAFVRAWQECDIPALAVLLREDATLTMPPQAIRITGRRQVAGFFVITRANGHPALAAYLPDDGTFDCRGYGIMVLAITDGQVDSITGFPDPDLFPIFGLPLTQ
jgi:RNA polymerase sigma-70 factor, ECF subfamily